MLVFVSGSSACLTVIFTTQQHKVKQSAHFLVWFMDRRMLSLSHNHFAICSILYQHSKQNKCSFTTQINSFCFFQHDL